MNALLIAWLIVIVPLLLVGFAFGAAFGRQRERRRSVTHRRTCAADADTRPEEENS